MPSAESPASASGGGPGPLRRRAWLRQAAGVVIVAAGVLAGLNMAWQAIASSHPRVQHALWGGLVAALATALGALPALLSAGLGERTRDAMLGFGAGVMLAACSFSLLLPALDAAMGQGATRTQASVQVALSLLAGAAGLLLLERWVERFTRKRAAGAPADAPGSRTAAESRRLAGVWLFVLAVTLHNLPEGLAIGVGFGGDDPQAGRALALGVAIQDVPEGLIVALALRGVGYGRGLAVGVAALSGLGEPVAAVLGAWIAGMSAAVLPVGLAFAGGAMLFVIGHEVIPESHRRGHSATATASLVSGFALMLVLDTALG